MKTPRAICVVILSTVLGACGNSDDGKSAGQTGGTTPGGGTASGGKQSGGTKGSQGGSGTIGGSTTTGVTLGGSQTAGGTSSAMGGASTSATSMGGLVALGGTSSGGSGSSSGGIGGISASGGSNQGGSGGTSVADAGCTIVGGIVGAATGGASPGNECGQDAGSAPEIASWTAGASPEELGKLVAEKYAVLPFEFEGDGGQQYVTYPEACAWYGSLTLAQRISNQNLTQQLVDKFDPLLTADGANHISTAADVDYRVFGIVPLELFIETGDCRYQSTGLKLADSQWQNTTGGITSEARLWSDDMFMIAGLQVQAYRATGDTKYLDRAALTISNYISKLQLSSGTSLGLFNHTTDSQVRWARANGWAAAGMVEVLRMLPASNSRRDKILTAYRMLMAGLLDWQRTDGLWRQVIDNADAWPETSATALFTYAMATGVANCWLDSATYLPVVRSAWSGLITHLDAQGNLSDVCVGTGSARIDTNSTDPTVQMQYYLNRPRAVGDLHGQAMLIWAAGALLQFSPHQALDGG
jgi:unsaturated rhamnogalacturonyl hydrolase